MPSVVKDLVSNPVYARSKKGESLMQAQTNEEKRTTEYRQHVWSESFVGGFQSLLWGSRPDGAPCSRRRGTRDRN
jgi:hypothetical protein